MGIDLYARWDGMTEAEAEAQITGFSITAGSVGYLREAYHGGPYVTAWLAPEGELARILRRVADDVDAGRMGAHVNSFGMKIVAYTVAVFIVVLNGILLVQQFTS